MIFKWIFRATISFILLLTPVVLVAYFYPEKFLCVDSGKASADVIVVLGGGVREFRAERAAELFQQRAAPRIIITGAGDDRRACLRALREAACWATSAGAPLRLCLPGCCEPRQGRRARRARV